jgi:hypothetical protein
MIFNIGSSKKKRPFYYLTTKRYKIIYYYVVIYDKSAYLKYDEMISNYQNALSKVTSFESKEKEKPIFTPKKEKSQQEIEEYKQAKNFKDTVEQNHSPYIENSSLLDLIYNTIIFLWLSIKGLYKFYSKYSQKLVVYIEKNSHKLKKSKISNTLHRLKSALDRDKKSTFKYSETDNLEGIEIGVWIINNKAKNYYKLIHDYPNLSDRWSKDEYEFISVYRVFKFIAEDISNPQQNDHQEIFYEER